MARLDYRVKNALTNTLLAPGYDVSPILLDIKEAIEREVAVGRTIGWDMVLFPTPAFRRMILVGCWNCDCSTSCWNRRYSVFPRLTF
jgi:hypothetical protein